MAKKIVIVEPFYSGSHKSWTDGLVGLYRSHGYYVTLLTLPGRHWKWRMQGAASYLSDKFIELNISPDVLIASDMLDLAVFVGQSRKLLKDAKICAYFHENQLTYPWSPDDQDVKLNRDQSYALMNLRSALIADEVYFNSSYHKGSFISAIDSFIKQFPDAVNSEWSRVVKGKSKVLYLGMDLNLLLSFSVEYDESTILWNHRWEYDKNPEEFYDAIMRLKGEGFKFKLIVCGENNSKYPEVFNKIKRAFSDELIHFGYAANKEEYHKLLKQANILPVTCNQDFFGGSVVEAIAAGCIPVLPNRLAYPEHIPDQLKGEFVKDEKEWYQTLREVVSNPLLFKEKAEQCRVFVARYNWSNLRESYQEILK